MLFLEAFGKVDIIDCHNHIYTMVYLFLIYMGASLIVLLAKNPYWGNAMLALLPFSLILMGSNIADLFIGVSGLLALGNLIGLVLLYGVCYLMTMMVSAAILCFSDVMMNVLRR